MKKDIYYSLSVVSHNQIGYVNNLLMDLNSITSNKFEVIITINKPHEENEKLATDNFKFNLKIINNTSPKGFGENHNNAFKFSKGDFFIVLNPDIKINNFDLNEFLSPFKDDSLAALAPLVLDEKGNISDNARKFPTPFSLICRRLLKSQRKNNYKISKKTTSVDWIAGMFIAFRSKDFKKINGFDDKNFFMYFEDVDICKRLSSAGLSIKINPTFRIIHYAQRDSHRNIKYLIWHIKSAAKYFLKKFKNSI